MAINDEVIVLAAFGMFRGSYLYVCPTIFMSWPMLRFYAVKSLNWRMNCLLWILSGILEAFMF